LINSLIKNLKYIEEVFFSVDISHGAEIEVTINYPYVPNGYAIYFANKSWFGGQDATMHINTMNARIKEIENDSLIRKTEVIIQEQIKEPEVEIFSFVQEMPEFIGGQLAMVKYLNKNIQHPKFAKDNGIAGKCFTKFVINEDGSIGNIRILKGVPGCKECDEEAIRLIKTMPSWSAGKQNGKAVKVWYDLPIYFGGN
jgi:TonB family protein